MAISMSELLQGADLSKLPIDVQNNLKVLLERINKIRTLYNKSMTVSSGIRTMEDHLRIYKELAVKKRHPFPNGIYDESKVPKLSKHLFGLAVDISDPGLIITKWLKDNPKILEDAQLWCEEGNIDWVHFQCVPPKSGKRWFSP